jgi:hypothetical protein
MDLKNGIEFYFKIHSLILLRNLNFLEYHKFYCYSVYLITEKQLMTGDGPWIRHCLSPFRLPLLFPTLPPSYSFLFFPPPPFQTLLPPAYSPFLSSLSL